MPLESFIKGTDLELTLEERINLVREILPSSKNYEDLTKRYVEKFRELKLRSFCGVDCEKTLFGLSLAYKLQGKPDVIDSIADYNFLLRNLVKQCVDYFKNHGNEVGKLVYDIVEPELDVHLHRYGIRNLNLDSKYPVVS